MQLNLLPTVQQAITQLLTVYEPEFLRFAAKIALERLADLRGPGFVRDEAFADTRTFILNGTGARPIASASCWMTCSARTGSSTI